jgi:hypothetical protein
VGKTGFQKSVNGLKVDIVVEIRLTAIDMKACDAIEQALTLTHCGTIYIYVKWSLLG